MKISLMSAARFAAYAIVVSVAMTSLAMAQPVAVPIAGSEPTAPREGVFSEPRIIARSIDFAGRTLGTGPGGDRKNGFYVETSNMLTGSGWISGGPGYRRWFRGDEVFLKAAAAISWRGHTLAQARLELPALARSRVFAGVQGTRRDLTQITYFGAGPESDAADRTEYRLRTSEVLLYGGVRPAQWIVIETQAGYLESPDVMRQAGFFERGNPDTIDVFGDDPVFARDRQPDFAFGVLTVAADTRDVSGYPTRGGLWRAAISSYIDRADGQFSFRRYEGEVAQFVPLVSQRLVLALHGFMVATATDAESMVPFYMAPSLGGGNSLRGYADYRFHDRNLLLTTVEARLALTTHIDVAVFADAGNVAARVRDLDLHKRDYGIGLRLNSRHDTVGRMDFARGVEGWRLLFRTSDPLRLARLTRRMATAPFVQ